MRIALCGKGGSGKTTTSALISRVLAQDGYRTLALDADINQHLAEALGVQGLRLPPMGERSADIQAYVAGTNKRLKNMVHKTTPPGTGSRLLTLADDDWFIRTFSIQIQQNLRVAGAGDIPDGNVGVRCYHGLNGTIELVLGHMIDGPRDLIVVDMTAGADAFSSSLFTKVDAIVLVVEPTLKSLCVYNQFVGRCREYTIPLYVVGNKVADESDEQFIRSRVTELFGSMPVSTYVKQLERGEQPDIAELDSRVKRVIRNIVADIACNAPRDWKRMQKRYEVMHQKAANDWAGVSSVDQIDPAFSLQRAAEALFATS